MTRSKENKILTFALEYVVGNIDVVRETLNPGDLKNLPPFKEWKELLESMKNKEFVSTIIVSKDDCAAMFAVMGVAKENLTNKFMDELADEMELYYLEQDYGWALSECISRVMTKRRNR
jgi:hypothetical protein